MTAVGFDICNGFFQFLNTAQSFTGAVQGEAIVKAVFIPTGNQQVFVTLALCLFVKGKSQGFHLFGFGYRDRSRPLRI